MMQVAMAFAASKVCRKRIVCIPRAGPGIAFVVADGSVCRRKSQWSRAAAARSGVCLVVIENRTHVSGMQYGPPWSTRRARERSSGGPIRRDEVSVLLACAPKIGAPLPEGH
jgi:hypothetical protein